MKEALHWGCLGSRVSSRPAGGFPNSVSGGWGPSATFWIQFHLMPLFQSFFLGRVIPLFWWVMRRVVELLSSDNWRTLSLSQKIVFSRVCGSSRIQICLRHHCMRTICSQCFVPVIAGSLGKFVLGSAWHPFSIMGCSGLGPNRDVGTFTALAPHNTETSHTSVPWETTANRGQPGSTGNQSEVFNSTDEPICRAAMGLQT